MAEKKKKEPEKVKYSITVLSRLEMVIAQKLGKTVSQTVVTYVGADMGPAVLRILTEDYSLELEKQLIREDIERRLQIKPEAYEV